MIDMLLDYNMFVVLCYLLVIVTHAHKASELEEREEVYLLLLIMHQLSIGLQRELRVLCDRGCGLEEHLMNMMIK